MSCLATQVADIIRQHKDGTLEQQGRTTWIMEATVSKPPWERKHRWDGVGEPAEDKNQTIATPSFAFDWQHELYWTDAIKTLKMPAPAVCATVVQAPKHKRVDKVELFNRWEAEKRSAK